MLRRLGAALAAVDGVLKQAITFTPTLTSATVVGDRLYVRLLVADQDGERTFDELNRPESVDLRI